MVANPIGAGVSLNGLFVEDFSWTFNLAAGIVAADVGKPVAIDTSAANKVKLAGADDHVIGRLEVVEDRVGEGILVGTVMLKGSLKFAKQVGNTINIGDTVVGDGSGGVKAMDLAALVDSTTGTANGTVVDVGAAFSQATLNSNFADVIAKVNLALKQSKTNFAVEVPSTTSVIVVLR